MKNNDFLPFQIRFHKIVNSNITVMGAVTVTSPTESTPGQASVFMCQSICICPCPLSVGTTQGRIQDFREGGPGYC